MTFNIHVVFAFMTLLPVVGLADGSHAYLPTGKSHSSSSAATHPFKPTITRDEAIMLEHAVVLSESNVKAAIGYLLERTKANSSPALTFALGKYYFREGQLAPAERAFKKAVDKLPTFRSALNNLARIYLMRDQPRRALDTFGELAQHGLGDGETYLLMGECRLLMERPISAEGAFRQTLVFDPDNEDARRGLAASLSAQGRNRDVLALTKELQAAQPSDRELWRLRAHAHLALDETEKAVTAIETARVLEAAAPELLTVLGDLYLNRERPRDAVAAYREAFAESKPELGHLLRAAEGLLLYNALDEVEEMLTLARKQKEAGRWSLRIDRLAAQLLVERGSVREAEALFGSILRRDPLEGESLLALAHLQQADGRIEASRMSLERAARIEGFEARALVRQARLDVERNRFGAAVSLLERAQAFKEQPHVARYLDQVRRLAK
ncbi:MAG: tetratricopeptide repeat protein [Verrucomicrobiota bacterium]